MDTVEGLQGQRPAWLQGAPVRLRDVHANCLKTVDAPNIAYVWDHPTEVPGDMLESIQVVIKQVGDT